MSLIVFKRFGSSLVLLCFALVAIPSVARAQGGFGTTSSVGGISIDANGALRNAELDAQAKLRDIRARALQEVSGALSAPADLRKVSLRRLEEAIRLQTEQGVPLDDSMQYLAGLQQIRYVIVDPQNHDVVLAGFGEGWRVDDHGYIVGLTTGRPVLLLDDLLVALRSARQASGGGITCSIDPTTEGLSRLRDLVSRLTNIGNPQQTMKAIEDALGPQAITVQGVPQTSHFARVLVAADYRMKRLGMNFEPSPVAGLSSYIQMIPAGGSGMQNMTPRWWLVPQYQPLLTDAEGLTWELRGGSVKTMTEETFFGSQGAEAQRGRTNPIAQRWADTFTARYAELSAKEPIFGQLRNCMDLAVVAALVVKENLPGRAGWEPSLLLDGKSLPAAEFYAARQTDSQASCVKKGSNWIISASGGVEIHSWQIADKVERNGQLDKVRQHINSNARQWWWN